MVIYSYYNVYIQIIIIKTLIYSVHLTDIHGLYFNITKTHLDRDKDQLMCNYYVLVS